MAITANNPPLGTTQRPINWGAVFLIAVLSITVYLGSHAYLQHREHANKHATASSKTVSGRLIGNPMATPSTGFAGIP
jgi:hypothetical protein